MAADSAQLLTIDVVTAPQTESPHRLFCDARRCNVWECLGWLILIVAIVVALPIAVNRAIYSDTEQGGCDVRGFCDAGRYILIHGMRDPKSSFSRYWPSIDVPWVLIAWMPIGLAATLWYLFGCATWYALLRSIHSNLLAAGKPALRRHAILAAGLLATPLALDGLCLGAFHLLMVWLMVLGLHRGLSGKEFRGGLLLGVAAWLKLLPFLGVMVFLLRGKWKAAGVTVVTALSIDIALSLVAFGPMGAYREHVTWWKSGASRTTMNQLASSVAEDEDRLSNQSVAVTLRRYFSSLGANPHDARTHVQMANLSASQLQIVYTCLTIAMLAALAGVVWSIGRRSLPESNAEIVALVVLATLWFSPVSWSYHFTALLPALAIILYRCEYRRARVVLMVACWLAALVLLASPVARAAGALLWLSVFVGGDLLWTIREKAVLAASVAPSR